jgi:hypothetical protein
MMPTLSWGTDETHVEVHEAEELDALLETLDAQARERRRPEDVQLTVGTAGILGIVVGADWSCLNHIPADLNPPYMVSVGDDDRDEVLDFYVSGDHHSQTPRRNTIPVALARSALQDFFSTGQLSPAVRWEAT